MPYAMTIDAGGVGATSNLVSFGQSLDADLDELSGHVDLFADVNVGIFKASYDTTLFSWNGFHQHVPLWHPAPVQFPLKALSSKLHAPVDAAAPTAPSCGSTLTTAY